MNKYSSNTTKFDRSNLSQKQIIRLVLIGLVGVVLIVGFISSWKDIETGYEGFVNKKYTGGVDKENVLYEGTHFILPWNELFTYDIRQQTKNYTSEVMDINGTDIKVEVAIGFYAIRGKTAYLHLKHGDDYIKYIDDKARGAIKDVIGRYTYEQVYSSKREALEGEIEEILTKDFDGNYMGLYYVEIADVNLHPSIALEITNKETQKQKILTAKEKQEEEKYLANAKIEKARGDSAIVISAKFKAEAIQLEAEQISKNPQYIELKKWENWDGVGSPYGSGNVFGEGVSILKQQ